VKMFVPEDWRVGPRISMMHIIKSEMQD
jgi:hypothetical protein